MLLIKDKTSELAKKSYTGIKEVKKIQFANLIFNLRELIS